MSLRIAFLGPARIAVAVLFSLFSNSLAEIVISANDNKPDPASRTSSLDSPPDTVTIFDFRRFPPDVKHVTGVNSSLIGPPSAVAVHPDETLALVASSMKPAPAGDKLIPDNIVQVLDLGADPPKVISRVEVGRQPSSVSINPSGTLALVTNRADSTVSVLSIEGKRVKLTSTLPVGQPGDEVCGVFIGPDGRQAIVTNRSRSLVHRLRIDEGRVRDSGEEVTVYGHPYHCEISPDGELGLAAGGGAGLNAGGLSVIRLGAGPMALAGLIVLGSGPESFDISPDGRLVAAVLVNDTDAPKTSPRRQEHGKLVLLSRRGATFIQIQETSIEAMPQGVTFTPDGRYLLVQGYLARCVDVYTVNNQRLEKTGLRLRVPGRPSSIRIAEKSMVRTPLSKTDK